MNNKESFEKAIKDIEPAVGFADGTQKMKVYNLKAALLKAGLKFNPGDSGFENE